MRERFLEDQPVSRRRARSDAEARGSQQHPYDTKDGAKARQIGLERRVADLERDWQVPMDDQGGIPERIIDVGDGAVPTGFTKAHWIGRTSTFDELTGTLSPVGNTDTVANIIKDGSTIGTVTIPAGESVVTVEVNQVFEGGSFWQMQQTSAGEGAGGLTWFGRFIA